MSKNIKNCYNKEIDSSNKKIKVSILRGELNNV